MALIVGIFVGMVVGGVFAVLLPIVGFGRIFGLGGIGCPLGCPIGCFLSIVLGFVGVVLGAVLLGLLGLPLLVLSSLHSVVVAVAAAVVVILLFRGLRGR